MAILARGKAFDLVTRSKATKVWRGRVSPLPLSVESDQRSVPISLHLAPVGSSMTRGHYGGTNVAIAVPGNPLSHGGR